MGGEAELDRELAHLVVVVALVQAEVLRALLGRLGTLDRDRLERLAAQLEVVAVGALVGDPERDPFALGEEAPFRPLFARSVGFGPVWAPPSGALAGAASVTQGKTLA